MDGAEGTNAFTYKVMSVLPSSVCWKFTGFPYKDEAYTFIYMSIDSGESTLQI